MESKTAIIYQVSTDDLTTLIRESVRDAMAGLVVQKPEEPKEKLLTGAEVRELLHVSQMTLHNWKSSGKLKSWKIGNRVLFKEEEVKAALTAQVPLKYRRVKNGQR